MPAASGLPSVVSILSVSMDSSVWNVPAVPSLQLPPMVLGWFGSGPLPSRPSRSVGPDSQKLPATPHVGALTPASHTAVLPACTVQITVSVVLPQSVVAVRV